jgi:hypothetical protein
MDEWPEVVILLVTFKRTDCAVRTVLGLKKNLEYPNLSWHVADDGSGPSHQDAIIEAIGDDSWTLTDAQQRAGTGFNRNTGLQAAFERSPFVLHIEDDWELKYPYNLCPAVCVLQNHQDIGMIRLGYIEYGHLARSVLLCDLVWWELQKNSGHGFVFAGHPHLLHRRFHDAYGWYPQNLLPGMTEAGFASKVIGKEGPKVLYPIWHFCGFFGHIGSVKAETFL